MLSWQYNLAPSGSDAHILNGRQTLRAWVILSELQGMPTQLHFVLAISMPSAVNQYTYLIESRPHRAVFCPGCSSLLAHRDAMLRAPSVSV